MARKRYNSNKTTGRVSTGRYRRRRPGGVSGYYTHKGHMVKSLINRKLYNFTRWDTNFTTISSRYPGDSPAYASGAMVFQLASLPNYSEFTSLFDQFRIKMVKVVFMFQNSPVAQQLQADSGVFYTLVDLDDNTAPTSESEMVQYQNVRVQRPFGVIKRLVRPRHLTQIYEGPTQTGYTLGRRSAWIDCQDANTYHFGLKYFWSTSEVKDLKCQVRIKYYLQFRNVR